MSGPRAACRTPASGSGSHQRAADRRAGDRGQGIAELALALPVVLLIVLVALDFGRAYLGWVVLNNAARVGADYAAQHAEAWDPPGNPGQQAAYDSLVRDARADAAASLAGCDGAAVPGPAFPSGKDIGDHAVVQLDCDFVPLTPLIGIVLGGGSVPVSATSLFPIRTGALEGPVLSPPPICPALADFETAIDGADPLTVHFTDTSSGSPSGWIWDFGDGEGAAEQDTVHTYAAGGTYTVRLAVSGCSTWDDDVTVTEPDPSASPGASASPGVSPSPSPVPGCEVPSFIGTKRNAAQGTWADEGFSTTVAFDPDPNGNWTIEAQSLVGGQGAPCNVTITLGPDPIPES